MHPFDGRVVSNFIRQALCGEPITIYGTGEQTRSFCYRDDLIEGMIRMMNGPDAFIGPVNLGNPGEFTIRQCAHASEFYEGQICPPPPPERGPNPGGGGAVQLNCSGIAGRFCQVPSAPRKPQGSSTRANQDPCHAVWWSQ